MNIKSIIFKNKKNIILIKVISVICIAVLLFINRTPKIFELKLEHEIRYDKDYPNKAWVQRAYAISNPPSNLLKLKKLVEKYDEENPIDYNYVEEYVLDHYGINKKIDEIVVFSRFYRETLSINRYWPETSGHFGNTLELHGDDCIASISYTNKDEIKRYTVMRKKYRGEPIKTIDFKEDKIVEKHEYVNGRIIDKK